MNSVAVGILVGFVTGWISGFWVGLGLGIVAFFFEEVYSKSDSDNVGKELQLLWEISQQLSALRKGTKEDE